MYLPPHFTAPDAGEVAAFVDAVAAADLVTFDGTKPVASLIPIIWDHDAGQRSDTGNHGRLLGHLALANPQWESVTAGTTALAIVHGPQAYVSPSWYPSTRQHGRVVPTWNYTSVHFTGPVTFHRDAGWLRDIVTRLTEQHEHDRDHRWWVQDAPAAYIEGQLRGIVGIEMLVQDVQAKAKLSQNRSPADQAGAIAGLRGVPDPGAQAVADLMQASEASPDG